MFFLIAETDVKVFMQLGESKIEKILRSPKKLDQGDWHMISIEHDRYNVRFYLDSTSAIVDVPEGVESVTNFTGILYLGGVNKTYVCNTLFLSSFIIEYKLHLLI